MLLAKDLAEILMRTPDAEVAVCYDYCIVVRDLSAKSIVTSETVLTEFQEHLSAYQQAGVIVIDVSD